MLAAWVAWGLLVAASPSAQAEARPLVAVLDFSEIQSGLERHEVELLSDVARGAALDVLQDVYNIITRENLVDLLKAHGTSLERCQGECETETGRLIGADIVVSGRIMKAFGKYKVNLKAHRTSPPELVGAEVLSASDEGELEDAVRRGTAKLLSAIPGARALGGPRLSPAAAPTREPPSAVQAPSPAAPSEVPPGEVAKFGAYADVLGFLLFGPTMTAEWGSTSTVTATVRLMSLGLAYHAAADVGEGSAMAFTIGAGIRRHPYAQGRLDGLWWGGQIEYGSSTIKYASANGDTEDVTYEETLLIPQGLLGYRWYGSELSTSVAIGVGYVLSLSRTVTGGIDESDGSATDTLYATLLYEVGFLK